MLALGNYNLKGFDVCPGEMIKVWICSHLFLKPDSLIGQTIFRESTFPAFPKTKN